MGPPSRSGDSTSSYPKDGISAHLGMQGEKHVTRRVLGAGFLFGFMNLDQPYVRLNDLTKLRYSAMSQPHWTLDDYEAVIAPYVEGTAKTCSYCDELAPLTLLEGQHTAVNLAIGHMVPGYIQVCSRSHVVSAAELRSDAAHEFDFVADAIRQVFVNVYGTRGIVFEHGKAGSCLWRAGDLEALRDLCHHAHVHFVPLNVDLLPRIETAGTPKIRVRQWSDVRSLREQVLTTGAYLYYANSRDAYVFPVASPQALPRHFLRTCLAEELGQATIADWRAHTGASLFNRTREEIFAPLCEELRRRGARITERRGRPAQWTR